MTLRTKALRILMIEDSAKDAELIRLSLKKEGLDVSLTVIDGIEALTEQLDKAQWDVVLSDCMMPTMSVDQVFEIVRDKDKEIPFIALSGELREEDAVRLLKNGAQDFINKNNLSRLVPAIERELEDAQVKRAHRSAEHALQLSEERFQLAMRGANDGLWDWNLQAKEVYYSQRWCEMIGYAQDEVPRTKDFSRDQIHPDDVVRVGLEADRYIKGGSERFEVEFRMRHKDGHYVDILSRAFAVHQDNKVIRLVGTHVNITDKKKRELELRSSKEQLRELASHILHVREEEKAKIAHEIHDELGATLTALNMDIRWLNSKIPEEMAEVKSKIESMGSLVAGAVDECSRIVTDLRPSLLDDLGLLAAIEWQAKEFNNRYQIPCQVTKNVDHLDLTSNQSIAVFRILQEALTNVARHANATKVEVIVLKKSNTLYLQIADNGDGIRSDNGKDSDEWVWHDPLKVVNQAEGKRKKSFGLRGMKERAIYINGSLNIESEKDSGTRIILSAPIEGL